MRVCFSQPPGRHIRLNWSESMMWRFLRSGLILPLLITMVAGGCATGNGINTYSSSNESGAQNLRFPDIPVPAGFSLVPADSFILETPDTRAGQLVYAGYTDFQNVVRFYRKHMPNHGWQLLSSIERGEAALNYEKPGWSAVVFIRTSYFKTRVSINIGPKGGTARVEEDLPAKQKK